VINLDKSLEAINFAPIDHTKNNMEPKDEKGDDDGYPDDDHS